MDREVIMLAAMLAKPNFAMLAMPFVQRDFFQDAERAAIFEAIDKHWKKYEVMPNKAAVQLECPDNTQVETIFDAAICNGMTDDYLTDLGEQWCRERASFNVIATAIDVYDKNNNTVKESAIPAMLEAAISISFDTSIGHDWADDAAERWEFYHNPESTIPFDIAALNAITADKGVARKSLNIVMAGVNCGKTGFMCHLAAGYIKAGFNVLYITLEMQEKLIARRVDANIMGIDMDDIDRVSKDDFLNKIESIRQKSYGRLRFKEFPSGEASSMHIERVMHELQIKKNIKFDVVFVDYIGICASHRVSLKNTNSYGYLKCVAEELRALAMKHDVAVWSAVQLNRGGFSSTDVEMTDIADSFSIAATADMLISMMRTEELDAIDQVLIKQIKNRYANKNNKMRFPIGVNQEQQRYFDVEDADSNIAFAESKKKTTSAILANNASNKLASRSEKMKALQ